MPTRNPHLHPGLRLEHVQRRLPAAYRLYRVINLRTGRKLFALYHHQIEWENGPRVFFRLCDVLTFILTIPEAVWEPQW